MLRTLLFLLLAGLAVAQDGKIRSADAMEEADSSQRKNEQFMREAAAYRLAKSTHKADPAEDALALAVLAEADLVRREGGGSWYFLWLDGKVSHARRIAKNGFTSYGYSAHAGKLIRFCLDCSIENGEAGTALEELERLWLYLPDYPDISAAMLSALEMAEKKLSFEKSIDLEANDPRDVVSIEGHTMVGDLDELLRFLSKNGDRERIAPRACIALARILLLSGDKDDTWKARRAYEEFLERFPDSPMAFEAVLEQALSHLKTYKGADYDVGALFEAWDLVDIAELDSRGDAARVELVTKYRNRIKAWLQDRDLSVATWYAERTRPSFLTWLKRPTQLTKPDTSSRIYARAVISRDRVSEQARSAEELLQWLPVEDLLLNEKH